MGRKLKDYKVTIAPLEVTAEDELEALVYALTDIEALVKDGILDVKIEEEEGKE